MKQIILITDGCSNEGVNPAVAAAQAYAQGIIVNVIGVVEPGASSSREAANEIERIAEAGGGMSRIAAPAQLSRTVQMMTRRTVTHTIQQAVQHELRHRFGGTLIEDLPPSRRGQVIEVIDDLGETIPLKAALVIDTSASMRSKLRAVEEAIRDLMISLQSRKGTSEISVLRFPGASKTQEDAVLEVEWTRELAKLQHLFYKLSMRGTTPTGPAILAALRYFEQKDDEREAELSSANALPMDRSKDGMLSEYVI